MKKIKSILFDMDGVVVDSMPHHADAWISVLNAYGLDLRPMDIYKREGMSGKDSVMDIFREHGIACPGDVEFQSLLSKKHDIFERIRIPLFPYVREMLSLLAENNVSLALVTGSMRRSVERIMPPEVLSLFQAVITADDVARGKPDPEPYLKAMQGTCSDTESAIAVENAPQGILSANNAGIDCYAVETTLPAEYLGGAAMIFKDHKAIFDHFQGLFVDKRRNARR